MSGSLVDQASSARRLRRVLFVSRHYASDFGIRIGGVFQRMRMLLDAAQRSADAVDILFFVDQRVIDELGPSIAKKSLKTHWGIDARVHLAPRGTMRHGAIVQTLRAWFDYRAQDDYFRLNGPVQFDAVRRCVQDDTELVVAHRLYTGSTVIGARIAVPVVMDLDDIEHRNRARQVALDGNRSARLELPALKRGELATLRACTTSFVCSRLDHELLAKEGIANTTVIPNAMRFDDAEVVPPPAVPALFFIGTYGYRPNVDAAEYLIHRVFPLVRARRPDARLLIAGESVDKLPSHARPPANVDFSGFVPDLADLYRRATIVCCPILAGGGTRIKIIEAAAARKPIVSTTVGAEGLALTNGKEILLRDSPQAFAEACVDLLDDPMRAAALGNAAFAEARRHYERDGIVASIARTFVTSAALPPA